MSAGIQNRPGNIGAVLGLNLDLIEAISTGTRYRSHTLRPCGERFLSELLYEHTGRYFSHNVHSVRVLDTLFRRNLSLQTLDGVLCHNGEFGGSRNIVPSPCRILSLTAGWRIAMPGEEAVSSLVPSTLEGLCGADLRHDRLSGKGQAGCAHRQELLTGKRIFTTKEISTEDAAIINNMTVRYSGKQLWKELSPSESADLPGSENGKAGGIMS